MNDYKLYFVDAGAAWHLVFAKSQEDAKKDGIRIYGKVENVGFANQWEINEYLNIHDKVKKV